jgi:uncharacterized protein YuzE
MVTRASGPCAEFDREADAIYVWLADVETTKSTQLDDFRNIDFSADGTVVGIEFLGVSGGVDLGDVPFSDTVEKLINELGLGIKIFA